MITIEKRSSYWILLDDREKLGVFTTAQNFDGTIQFQVKSAAQQRMSSEWKLLRKKPFGGSGYAGSYELTQDQFERFFGLDLSKV